MDSSKKKINCWEFKKCGREPGGAKVKELGVCPAGKAIKADGIHGGRNGGRCCWVITGTFCSDEIQGKFDVKYGKCKNCDFYQHVLSEECLHGTYIMGVEILKKLGSS